MDRLGLHRWAPSLVLVVMFALGLVATLLSPPETYWGYMWPTGLATGALLITERSAHRLVVVGILIAAWGSFAVVGYPFARSLGYAIGIAGAAMIAHAILVGDGGPEAGRLRIGELGRLAIAPISGAVFSGTVFGLTAAVTGVPDWWAVTLAAFLTHAVSQAMMVNLFRDDVPASRTFGPAERSTAWGLTVLTTVLTFTVLHDAALALLVLPLLAWMTFRAGTREATVQLAVVAGISAVPTAVGHGPFGDTDSLLASLSPQMAILPYIIFVITCTMITVPFSVAVARGRQALSAVRRERERSELITSRAVGVAVIMADERGRISVFGPGAEAILGYSAEEVLGRPARMFHTAAEIRRQAEDLGVEAGYAAVIRACDSLPPGTARDWEFLRKDGSPRTLSVILSPIYDGDRLIAHLATGDDVTERVAVQSALTNALEVERNAVQRLRAVDRAKDDFISTVSHELRTPMTNIVGYLELLGDGSLGRSNPAQRDALDRLNHNAARLLGLVDDLLTLSATRAQRTPAEEIVDLGAVVRRAVEVAAPTALRREVDLAARLPEPAAHLLGDGADLERLVVNLLTNAVKFTPDGGRVEVRVHGGNGSAGAVVEVEDTGVGISEQDRDRIFTRFFRSEFAQAQAIPGTGLGLAIVQEVAERHGAVVSVESRLGEGTTFRVRFPVGASGTAEQLRTALARRN